MKKIFYCLISFLSLAALVFLILKIPPRSLLIIAAFFILLFIFLFFLLFGLTQRLKTSLWLSLWVVLVFFLRYKGGGLISFILFSLLLWGLLKVTP